MSSSSQIAPRRCRVVLGGALVALSLLGVLLSSTQVRAAPGKRGRNFLTYVDDRGSIAAANWNNIDDYVVYIGGPMYRTYVDAGYHPNATTIIVDFTTFPAGNSWFYYGRANEIRGIGYQNDPRYAQLGPGVFDKTPNSTLEGYVHMGNVRLYDGNPDYIRAVFNQEVGHRWGVRVHCPEGRCASGNAILGRDYSHWSFFLHTGGSPMEGNNWVNEPEGTNEWRSMTRLADVKFSPLDLYLMGLIPADEVPPFFLLTNVNSMGAFDAYGQPLNSASPPWTARPTGDYLITATKLDITVEDIIAREGPREPAYGEASTEVRVAFVMFVNPGEDEDAALMEQTATAIDDLVAQWPTATSGKGTMVNVTSAEPGTFPPLVEDDEGPDLDDPSRRDHDTGISDPGGCSSAGSRGGTPFFSFGLIAAISLAGMRRRRGPN